MPQLKKVGTAGSPAETKKPGASARIKFDDEQFAGLFNESQARGDKEKLMQLFGA